jgi:hypothetical protein
MEFKFANMILHITDKKDAKKVLRLARKCGYNIKGSIRRISDSAYIGSKTVFMFRNGEFNKQYIDFIIDILGYTVLDYNTIKNMNTSELEVLKRLN